MCLPPMHPMAYIVKVVLTLEWLASPASEKVLLHHVPDSHTWFILSQGWSADFLDTQE